MHEPARFRQLLSALCSVKLALVSMRFCGWLLYSNVTAVRTQLHLVCVWHIVLHVSRTLLESLFAQTLSPEIPGLEGARL
jgi:hypothetical protein